MVGSGQRGGGGHIPVVDGGNGDAGFQELVENVLVQLFLAACSEAPAMNVDCQGRGFRTVGEPNVEDISLVFAVFHIGMSRWLSSFRLVGSRVRILSALSFGPGNRLADEVLLFLDGQNAVAICVGLGEAFQDHPI